jgi:hypothetical protein
VIPPPKSLLDLFDANQGAVLKLGALLYDGADQSVELLIIALRLHRPTIGFPVLIGRRDSRLAGVFTGMNVADGDTLRPLLLQERRRFSNSVPRLLWIDLPA